MDETVEVIPRIKEIPLRATRGLTEIAKTASSVNPQTKWIFVGVAILIIVVILIAYYYKNGPSDGSESKLRADGGSAGNDRASTKTPKTELTKERAKDLLAKSKLAAEKLKSGAAEVKSEIISAVQPAVSAVAATVAPAVAAISPIVGSVSDAVRDVAAEISEDAPSGGGENTSVAVESAVDHFMERLESADRGAEINDDPWSIDGDEQGEAKKDDLCTHILQSGKRCKKKAKNGDKCGLHS